MMIVPIAAAAVLWFLLSRTGTAKRLLRGIHPDVPAKLVAIALVLAAILVLAHGNVWAALCLFGVSLWSLGRAGHLPSAATFRRAAPSRSRLVEVELDRTTGHLRGRVVDGPRRGMSLDALHWQDCMELLAACRRADPEGVRLLEPYLDRRFPGWRAAAHGNNDAGARRARFTNGMTEDEAYQVLGLRSGATRDDIVRSHRAAMKKWHPDQGGTSALAARANEAKEVLLRRHA